MEYVKERRLIRASEEISSGKKILDVALDCGYQSHSGFTKAFKNKFGFSPLLLRALSFQINYLEDNCNMDHVFMKCTAVHASKEELYQLFLTIIKENRLEYDLQIIKKAYDFACIAHNGQKRYSGDDYITHSINVAILLAEMEASEEAVIAGLLHDIIYKKTNMSLEQIKKEFSGKISKIVKQVTNFNESGNINDEDVIMVKLCDRLHNMRTIEFRDEIRRRAKSEQTLDIYSPIAAKLSNEKVMAELNDLSVKYI